MNSKPLIFRLGALLFLMPITGLGQSLLHNGSFENLAECPKKVGAIGVAFHWYLNAETPDLFSACTSPTSVVGVPRNYQGTRAAQDGSAYVGLVLYYTGDDLSARQAHQRGESIYTDLAQPTVPGRVYDLSLWACQADSSHYTADGFTVTLTNSELPEDQTAANTQVISLPMGAARQPGWALLSARFVASGKWTYLILGSSRRVFTLQAYQHSLRHNRVRTPRPYQLATCYYYFDNLLLLPRGTSNTLQAR
jgi:hypothetical protein